MRQQLRRWLPDEQTLSRRRGLAWLAPLIRRRWLWQLNRRSVALGAAAGVFFGLLLPVLQIAFAIGASVILRANVPVAAVATLVSNPLTYVPILVGAYRIGAWTLGSETMASDDDVRAAEAEVEAAAADLPLVDPLTWPQRLSRLAGPVALGLIVLASVGAALAWLLVQAIWLAMVELRRRRLQRLRAPPP